VTPVWPVDLEALETVSQDAETRELFLRMAYLSGAGQLHAFLFELSASEEIDAETKAAFAEVAEDWTFLRALDEYVRLTRILH
jgi:hypothetical protein